MPLSALRCRAIVDADLPAVAVLLAEGFPERTIAYWTGALAILATRETPPDYPRFGLLLEAEGACVGVLLQIFVRLVEDGVPFVRCNNSSWYVRPAWRGYAPLLVSRALRHKEVTYLNVSPAEHTWPILEAQGYRRYSEGQVASLAWLSPQGGRVRRYRIEEGGFPPGTAAILDAHAGLGLIVLVCTRRGERAAFAFMPRSIKGLGDRVAQLAWCEAEGTPARFAGPLGRWFALRGRPLLLLDARGPERALVGRFFRDRAPKYVKGARTPRLNDLAFTEAVLFGA